MDHGMPRGELGFFLGDMWNPDLVVPWGLMVDKAIHSRSFVIRSGWYVGMC